MSGGWGGRRFSEAEGSEQNPSAGRLLLDAGPLGAVGRLSQRHLAAQGLREIKWVSVSEHHLFEAKL